LTDFCFSGAKLIIFFEVGITSHLFSAKNKEKESQDDFSELAIMIAKIQIFMVMWHLSIKKVRFP
jgi:hypothetical protein